MRCFKYTGYYGRIVPILRWAVVHLRRQISAAASRVAVSDACPGLACPHKTHTHIHTLHDLPRRQTRAYWWFSAGRSSPSALTAQQLDRWNSSSFEQYKRWNRCGVTPYIYIIDHRLGRITYEQARFKTFLCPMQRKFGEPYKRLFLKWQCKHITKYEQRLRNNVCMGGFNRGLGLRVSTVRHTLYLAYYVRITEYKRTLSFQLGYLEKEKVENLKIGNRNIDSFRETHKTKNNTKMFYSMSY